MTAQSLPRSIEWIGGLDGYVRLIDQTKLPTELTFLECRDAECIRQAIRRLSVRGAPTIGIAGAMGVVLGVRNEPESDRDAFLHKLEEVGSYLVSARPTGANLSWAIQRMRTVAANETTSDVKAIKNRLLSEARQIRDEDAAMCRRIGEFGQTVIKPGSGILTHCNAGALATAEYGTALAPMYLSHEQGKSFRVYVDETRPLLQGSRLTAWELRQVGIDVTLLTDGMVAALMKCGKVDVVITGADRIAANGDTANKIGTFGIAVLARHHGIPFYIAAPSSTFDLSIENGDAIPIEERDADEIRLGLGRPTAPEGIPCFSPAFDVTPAELITGLITERGLITPVNAERIYAMLG